MNSLIAYFYKFIAYPLLTIYWFIFHPKTQGVKVIIKYQNQILFIENTYRHNYWYIPGGGIKKNEGPKEAGTREIKEELGIELKQIKAHGSLTFSDEYKRDQVWVYSASVNDPKFSIDPKEIKKAKWIKVKNFAHEDLSPNTIKCLKLAAVI
jgi:ADP-ribose pyrophosphatase YjhB (NUDIX family)